MQRGMSTLIVAAAVSAAVAAGAQQAGTGAFETLSKGKENFERACGVCHSLDRPLSKTFDRAGWEATVERMHDKGAEADKGERAQIVAFLLTKNLFEAKCSACHGTDRPLGKSKTPGDWLATVQRMAGKRPGHLTEADIADIAAFLALQRPADKR